MKRNFGSLNLAALDLNRPADVTDCSLEDRFLGMGPGAEDCSMDDGSEYNSDENVGFPLERFQLPATMPQSFCGEASRIMDMTDDLPEPSLPVRTLLMIQMHNEDCDVRTSELLHPSSFETLQHQVEINALRCLSLKMMLPNLSTSNNNSSISGNASVASNKAKYTYLSVNDRPKTALLPIRHPSLQSV
ncbi:unnamed protein product [Peronospora destructor]|uniref:Uncharacterized protein n=1 Tax=Peronospora destructor TaxID=86335 RepID=A0AAV0V6G6_9STRA|nr:unnamed protein product [Peronospora destructor]